MADQLPNLAMPEMNGVGAMEICVSTAEGVCDFISAMDTPRIQEWNCWYHLLNCGFPLKVSGETDFPCMSSRNVGQGRVYVQLGEAEPFNFAAWCEGLRRPLVCLRRLCPCLGFHRRTARIVRPRRRRAGATRATCSVRAQVAFAPEMPLAVAYGGVVPAAGNRVVGDTVLLHGPRSEEMQRGGQRLVEVVVNGKAVASRTVPADGADPRSDVRRPDRSAAVGSPCGTFRNCTPTR